LKKSEWFKMIAVIGLSRLAEISTLCTAAFVAAIFIEDVSIADILLTSGGFFLAAVGLDVVQTAFFKDKK